jgi:hypothetical protein
MFFHHKGHKGHEEPYIPEYEMENSSIVSMVSFVVKKPYKVIPRRHRLNFQQNADRRDPIR